MVPFVPLPSKPTTICLEAEEEVLGGGTQEAEEEGPSRVQIRHLSVPNPVLPSPPIINSSTRQLTGNISMYLSNWKKIANTIIFLIIISSGYMIQFFIDPFQSKSIVSVPSKLISKIIED